MSCAWLCFLGKRTSSSSSRPLACVWERLIMWGTFIHVCVSSTPMYVYACIYVSAGERRHPAVLPRHNSYQHHHHLHRTRRPLCGAVTHHHSPHHPGDQGREPWSPPLAGAAYELWWRLVLCLSFVSWSCLPTGRSAGRSRSLYFSSFLQYLGPFLRFSVCSLKISI